MQSLALLKGGLMLVFGVYPGTPLDNIEAVIRAMEKYSDWWVKK